MISTRKPKVAPAELAEVLLNEFIATAGPTFGKGLAINESALARVFIAG